MFYEYAHIQRSKCFRKIKNVCDTRRLPYCTNRRTNVPMYAYAFDLFVFEDSSTSVHQNTTVSVGAAKEEKVATAFLK